MLDGGVESPSHHGREEDDPDETHDGGYQRGEGHSISRHSGNREGAVPVETPPVGTFERDLRAVEVLGEALPVDRPVRRLHTIVGVPSNGFERNRGRFA